MSRAIATKGALPAAPTTQSLRLGLDWLRESAWPLWLEHGVDWRRRAFHEHLDHETLACRADFRRLRVAARQTYVFAKAAASGVDGAGEAVKLGLDFLRGPARLPEGGFGWRFDLENRPIDTTRDLYDHAFVLLAFAAAAAVVEPDELREDAVALAHYIAGCFHHPAGGYDESVPSQLPRRQNPHMHLLEALLAASSAFGDGIFFVSAGTLVDLFVDRLWQPAECALPEFFDASLVPLRERGRFAVEPGHHYEWAALLQIYQAQAAASDVPVQADLASACTMLIDFADRHGVGPHGLVVNALWSDGEPADAGFRLWPQAERLRAQARCGAEAGIAAALAGLERHIAGVRPGMWAERMDPAMQVLPGPAPASSLYHLTAALTDEAVLAFLQSGGVRIPAKW